MALSIWQQNRWRDQRSRARRRRDQILVLFCVQANPEWRLIDDFCQESVIVLQEKCMSPEQCDFLEKPSRAVSSLRTFTLYFLLFLILGLFY